MSDCSSCLLVTRQLRPVYLGHCVVGGGWGVQEQRNLNVILFSPTWRLPLWNVCSPDCSETCSNRNIWGPSGRLRGRAGRRWEWRWWSRGCCSSVPHWPPSSGSCSPWINSWATCSTKGLYYVMLIPTLHNKYLHKHQARPLSSEKYFNPNRTLSQILEKPHPQYLFIDLAEKGFQIITWTWRWLQRTNKALCFSLLPAPLL